MWLGIHWKVFWTSLSGLIDVSRMMNTGNSANSVISASVTLRNMRAAGDSYIELTSTPQHPEIDRRDDDQEEHQQHRHRRAQPEVPALERDDVDVQADQIGRGRRRIAEQHERRVEVVEVPEEQDEHQDEVRRAERRQRDRAELTPARGPVDRRRL